MQEDATPISELVSNIPDAIAKSVREITSNFYEEVASKSDKLVKSSGAEYSPKSYFIDPYQALDSMGMGYKQNPSYVTYETLRAIGERATIVGCVILKRLSQWSAFCQAQPNKYSVGMKIQPIGGIDRELSTSETERIADLTRTMLWCGIDRNKARDGLETFGKKLIRDRLTYDQGCFETVKTRSGGLHSFYAIDGSTIRIAAGDTEEDTPPHKRDLKNEIRYVQLLNGEVKKTYTIEELAFLVGNPRSSIRVGGYGFPETEMLMTTVLSHSWAEQWNQNMFRQGSTLKGVFNVKGKQEQSQFEGFKRQWQAQHTGVHNAHKNLLMNCDGIEFVPMQLSNTEMGYQMWIEYLIKITCAFYQIDPAEINFDLRGGAGAAPVFMTNNEAQQKVSRDQGLAPLLRYVSTGLNKYVMPDLDDRYEVVFAGLDAKTEEQAIELRLKQGTSHYTLNEVRAMDGLKPLKKGGEIINSPTYTGYLNQLSMQQQQQQPPGGPPGAGGAPGEDDGSQDPYGSAFNQPPGDEENNARQVLQQKADGGSGGSKSKAASSGNAGTGDDNRVSDSEERILRRDDWESDIHSSLPPGDLTKSWADGGLFCVLDLGDDGEEVIR